MNPRAHTLPPTPMIAALLLSLTALTQGCDAPARFREPDAPRNADGGAGSTSIRIEPATAELIALDGTGELALRAIVTTHDGSVVEDALVRWAAEPTTVATIDATGLLRATGRVGGTVEVTATEVGTTRVATAQIEVRVRRTLFLGATSADAVGFPDGLAPIDVANGADILYPLAGAVMPGNVLAPEVMWRQAGAGDVLRVSLTRPHVRIDAYVRSAERRWVVEAEAWALLSRTDPGEPIELGIDRSHGGVVSGTAPVTFRLAPGALPGSAYYWSVGEGRIVRIDDHRAERRDVVPHPPAVTEGDGGPQTRCVGCHAISPSGRWMAASMGNGVAPAGARVGVVFDLTADLTADPAPTTFFTGTYSTSPTWTQASWSPDETRLVIERDMRLALFDPFAGVVVRPTSGRFVDAISVHPEWAPTGTAIAYVRASSWHVDYFDGDIAVVDVTGDGIGPERIVHRGADLAHAVEGGRADSYPTFSPDARWLAFSHGTTPYAPSGSGALYRVSVDGGAATRLERANAGSDGFAPRFAPFVSGGFAWLTFHSSRPYGNYERGGPREGTHGIWVTAIRLDAGPTEDASEVPYWLPGQDPTTSNISVSWARRACRVDGESCSDAAECCGGECSSGRCAPPVAECRDRGETCTESDQCCDALVCFEHVCVDDLW